MGNFHKVCIILTILLFIAIFYASADAFVIESKLDGLVLQGSQQKVPPTGPYMRNGVTIEEVQNGTYEQQWSLYEHTNPNEGEIHGSPRNNAISVGLLQDNGFSFTNYYDLGNMTEDGYRLMIIVPFFDTLPERCIRNPGQGRFHEEVKCNINDDSQLWRFV